jgi:hypothetical protein
MRIAFCGASGTGKTTLARYVAELYRLPMNPVGARSVAKAMGYESPYETDKVGKREGEDASRRGEFQRRLVEEKVLWEADHESFVTDRTTLDNLTYTILHDVGSLTRTVYDLHLRSVRRYTTIFFCSVNDFCKLGDDPARVLDETYHRIFENVLRRYLETSVPGKTSIAHVGGRDLDARKAFVTGELMGEYGEP